jgi:hypothetical protein
MGIQHRQRRAAFVRDDDSAPVGRKAWRRAAAVGAVLVLASGTGAQADSFGPHPPFTVSFGGRHHASALAISQAGVLTLTAGTMRGGSTGFGGTDAFVRADAGAGIFQWTRRFGTASTDAATGVVFSATGTQKGPVAVVGWSEGSLRPGSNAGGKDGFLRVYSASGALRWSRSIRTSGDDVLTGVVAARTGGGWIVVGSTSGTLPGQTSAGGADAFVRRYASDGTVVWTDQFGSATDDSANAVVDDELAGTSSGQLPLSGPNLGGTDAFVGRFDMSDGHLLWMSDVGTSADDTGTGIAAGGGMVAVAGTTNGTLAGNTPADGSDGYVAAFLSSSGDAAFPARQFGTSADDEVGGLTADASFFFPVGTTLGTFPGGTTSGGADGFVAEIDWMGNVVWTDQFGSTADDQVMAAPARSPDSFSVDESAAVAGSMGRRAFWGYRHLSWDATARANLEAALIAADAYAGDHAGSFDGFDWPSAAGIDGSFDWVFGVTPVSDVQIAIAAASGYTVRLATESNTGTYFCIEESGGVVSYGSSSAYDAGSCTGGW